MAMDEKNHEDIMDAEQILVELHKLIDSEKSETEETAEADARLLEDAAAKIEEFISAEEKEEPAMKEEMPMAHDGVVDTGLLTGPISGLKNFLIKKSQEHA